MQTVVSIRNRCDDRHSRRPRFRDIVLVQRGYVESYMPDVLPPLPRGGMAFKASGVEWERLRIAKSGKLRHT